MSEQPWEPLSPEGVEARIEKTVERIAKGVSIVTAAEREARDKRREFDHAYAMAYKSAEAPAHIRRYEADLLTIKQREAAENAEIAFRHAERTAKALEKELLAWQSISASIRAMYGAVRA